MKENMRATSLIEGLVGFGMRTQIRALIHVSAIVHDRLLLGRLDCSYGCPIEDYEKYFKDILSDTDIRSFVAQRKSPVVLDLMAPSGTLRSLFKNLRQENKLGIAVSLNDLRLPKEKEDDLSLGVRQIAGNLIRSKTWKEIELVLKGRKADLIIERGWGGLGYIPYDKKFHAIMMNKMWELLTGDNGMMLVQLPKYDFFKEGLNVVSSWVGLLKRKGIKTFLGKGAGIQDFFPVIRIDKTPNSPEKLPFLE